MALVFHDFLETEGFVHPPPKVRRRLRFGRLSGSSCLQRYTRRPPRSLEVLPPIRLLVDPSCFSWRWPRDSSVLHFSCETGYPVQHMSPFFKILAKARSAGTHRVDHGAVSLKVVPDPLHRLPSRARIAQTLGRPDELSVERQSLGTVHELTGADFC